MAMTNAEYQANYRARLKARQGKPLTALERKRVSLGRKQEKIEASPLNNTDKHVKFRALIEEAQRLAAELNQEALEYLNALPLTRETARQIDAMEKKTRYAFDEIYIPIDG